MKTTLTCAKRLIVLFFTTIVFGLFLQAQTTITLGEGTSANGSTSQPTPYGHYYKNQRVQYLVLASELIDLGYTTGTIEAIAFNVSAVNGMDPLPNFTIEAKLTTESSLSTTFDNGGLTEVYSNSSFLPSTGWNQHNFSTPFDWDGESNILFDLCYDYVSSNGYTKNASVYYSATGFNSVRYYQSDTQEACGTTSSATRLTNRSNLRLVGSFASCDVPLSLQVDNIGTTTADMQWTAGGTETLWNLKYGAADFDPETEGTLVSGLTAPAYSFASLSAGSTYKVIVQADCGSGVSDWAEIHFNTLCETSIINMDQDFNTDFNYLPPLCWTSETETGNSGFLFLETATNPSVSAYGGSGRMLVWASDTIPDGNQSRLISPELNTQGLTSLTYQYAWYESSGEASSTTEGVQIQYSLDKSSWTPIGSPVSRYGSTDGWVFKSLDFPTGALDQGSVYIGFLFTSQGGQNCYLDELIETNCISPSQLAFGYSETPYTVEFDWAESASLPSNGYDWELRTDGAPFSGEPGVFDSGTPTAGTSTTTVTGVAESTNYTFYIRSDCGSSSYSQVVSKTLTTPSGWPIDLPLYEDFSASSTPADWSNDGSQTWFFINTTPSGSGVAGDHTPGGGTNYAHYDGYYRALTNNLTTPTMDISDAIVPMLEFYYFSNPIWYSTSINTLIAEAWNGTEWVELLNYTGNSTSWQHFSLAIDKAQFDETIQVRFKVLSRGYL
jgi:hypothetical protein